MPEWLSIELGIATILIAMGVPIVGAIFKIWNRTADNEKHIAILNTWRADHDKNTENNMSWVKSIDEKVDKLTVCITELKITIELLVTSKLDR